MDTRDRSSMGGTGSFLRYPKKTRPAFPTPRREEAHWEAGAGPVKDPRRPETNYSSNRVAIPPS